MNKSLERFVKEFGENQVKYCAMMNALRELDKVIVENNIAAEGKGMNPDCKRLLHVFLNEYGLTLSDNS